MKCSKCGFNNPDDALFCQKCDWKLGETYIPEMKIGGSVFAIIALALGIIAIIPIILNTAYIAAIVFGALGLVMGGYAFNAPRLKADPNMKVLMAISAVGLVLSVISFIYGIYLYF